MHLTVPAFHMLCCIGVDGYSWTTIGPIAVGVSLLIAASIPHTSLTSAPEPLPRLEYDFEEIGEYFAQRPVAVATRSAVVAFEGLWWWAGALPSRCMHEAKGERMPGSRGACDCMLAVSEMH